MIDQYGTGKGYLPLVTENMVDFEGVGEYNLGTNLKRHGSVLTVTKDEYDSLINF